MAQRDWAEKDYYKILGVPESASKEEIKKAYRKLAQRHHPDANKDDNSAETRFKEISEAHAVLGNDERRKEYDAFRSMWQGAGGDRFYGFRPGGGGRGNVRVNVGDLGDIFGGAGGLFEDLFGGGPPQGRPGGDTETEVTLPFDQAVAGTTVTLGDGSKVRIPPAVADGARIRVQGKGQAGSRGARSGDLFVRVRVAPHPVFQLGKDGDLHVRLPVTYAEAALGAKVEVPTLGRPVTVKVPPGTPNGKTLRVRGKGAPRRTGGSGDLLVKVEVEIPQKLNRQEKQALEAFAEVHKASPRQALEIYMQRDAEAS